MFISIPKKSLIPSIFTRNFILNPQNNHLELDTEQDGKYDQEITIGEENDDQRINDLYTDLDEEYADENMTLAL